MGKYKENQDRGVVCFPFARRDGDAPRALFIVADGHGEYGHAVSDFVVKHLVSNLAADATIRDEATLAPAGAGGGRLRQIFLDCNAALAAKTNLDSSTSGTTCVVAIMHETFITLGNVGDSRCVLGTGVGAAPPAAKVPTLYRATDLTRDHKPDAADEKARIERLGGFVTQPEWSASARVWLDKSQRRPRGRVVAFFGGARCFLYSPARLPPPFAEVSFFFVRSGPRARAGARGRASRWRGPSATSA